MCACAPQLEEVLVPELRRQRYPNLTDHTIVLALDKYKEILKVTTICHPPSMPSPSMHLGMRSLCLGPVPWQKSLQTVIGCRRKG